MDDPKAFTHLNQMKRSGAAQVTVTVAALGNVIASVADSRVAITFSSHPTVAYTVSLIGGKIAGEGITVPAGGLPVQFSLGADGALVKGPFYLSGGATPITITYVETLNMQV